MLEKILSLPLEQKIGQLFFIGLRSSVFDDADRALFDEIKPGGVCLFARNVKDAAETRALTDAIRERSEVTPFLSIDQEGGLVDRLRRIMEPMPAAASLADRDSVRRHAEITGHVLRNLGLNMNFAPVADVIDDARNRPDNGLFSRAFGRDAETASAFAAVYLETLQKSGILGCYKHFPGLGAALVDSHEELPEVALSADELAATDLVPYRDAFGDGELRLVMTAHAAFPNHNLQEKDQDGKLLPASLSSNFITKLLRADYGFDGLVLTDDLEMGAIVRNYGIGEACVMALLAGNDQLLICNDAEAIRTSFRTVLDAAERGVVTTERIDASLRRIAEIKAALPPEMPFVLDRMAQFSDEVTALKSQLR